MPSLRIDRLLPGSALACILLSTLAAQTQSRDLAGIAHVAFRVSNLERSRDFYHKLGFEQAFEFDDQGKTSVSFIKINDRQFIELYPRKDDTQPLGLMHICFVTDNIDSVHSAYLKQQLQPTESKKARAGNLLFLLHDPEGHLLEYTQYMPDSLHSKSHGEHLGEHRVSEHLVRASAAADNISSQRAFFVSKLGFAGGPAPTILRLAGSSGDEVELQSPAERPRIAFRVASLRRSAKELRRRGFPVHKDHHAVEIADPDGALLIFTSRR